MTSFIFGIIFISIKNCDHTKWGIELLKDILSALWWTNYVMGAMFLNNLKPSLTFDTLIRYIFNKWILCIVYIMLPGQFIGPDLVLF